MPVGFEVKHTISKDVSGGTRRAIRKRMMDAMNRGFGVSMEEMPEDKGGLRMSAFEPEWRGEELVFGFASDHAAPMEFGTEPFHPPTEPLVRWAERVAGDPGLGYYVANVKIPEEGVDAQPYARPGAEAARRWLQSKGVGEYLEEEFR